MSRRDVRVSYQTFTKSAPTVYAGLSALGKALSESSLEKELVELIEIRASQINGCAFCLQFHLNSARKLRIGAEKLDLVTVWREAGVFSTRETAALAWTEELTVLDAHGPSDEAWATLREQFSEEEAILLTVAIGTINNWNRIGASLRFAPPILRKDDA
jgi:AhpD family alkylhydroperoxidase